MLCNKQMFISDEVIKEVKGNAYINIDYCPKSNQYYSIVSVGRTMLNFVIEDDKLFVGEIVQNKKSGNSTETKWNVEFFVEKDIESLSEWDEPLLFSESVCDNEITYIESIVNDYLNEIQPLLEGNFQEVKVIFLTKYNEMNDKSVYALNLYSNEVIRLEGRFDLIKENLNVGSTYLFHACRDANVKNIGNFRIDLNQGYKFFGNYGLGPVLEKYAACYGYPNRDFINEVEPIKERWNQLFFIRFKESKVKRNKKGNKLQLNIQKVFFDLESSAVPDLNKIEDKIYRGSALIRAIALPSGKKKYTVMKLFGKFYTNFQDKIPDSYLICDEFDNCYEDQNEAFDFMNSENEYEEEYEEEDFNVHFDIENYTDDEIIEDWEQFEDTEETDFYDEGYYSYGEPSAEDYIEMKRREFGLYSSLVFCQEKGQVKCRFFQSLSYPMYSAS